MRHHVFVAAVLLCLAGSGCGGRSLAPASPSGGVASSLVSATSPAPVVELDAGSSGPGVAATAYGASLDTWYDFRQAFVNPSLHKAGIGLVRFPGGSESDVYHWENGGSVCASDGYVTPGATFDNLMRRVARPVGAAVAITLDYGSNRACNAGGQPSEAAAWVAHAKQRGYHVAYWTVGNEVYGSWEYDLHAHPHDPATYANAVRTGFYPAVKHADPQANLGVVVDSPSDHAWNDVVLGKAQPFDFVELHYYPEYDQDDDARLLGPDVSAFATELTQLRAEMTAAGLSRNLPIYLGEFNNDAGTEGKQSLSIVNGLYLGQMIGTLLDAGVPMATWWLAYGSCDEGGDYSKRLYGWQHFGSEALFSDGLPNAYEGCANTPHIPGGTPFPTARVMALFAGRVPAGSSVRTTTVARALRGRVRAYGFTVSGGYEFAIFNDTLAEVGIRAALRNAGKTSFDATQWVYGKAQYDRSKQNRWVGPEQSRLGRITMPLSLALAPYSVTFLELR